MKKRKVKRYQEGGETELKQRGLDLSKNEKVGFLERLKMGNIDDPRSEAYRRFGAGRAKMDIEAKTPVPEAAQESSDYSGRRVKSYGDDGMSVPHSTLTKADIDEGPTVAQRLRAASPGSNIGEVDKGGYTSPAKEEKPKAQAKKSKLQMQNEMARRMAKGYAKATGASGFPVREEVAYPTKTGTGAYGFKGGGKVSSASSRADGIAQRGKTRGRIC